MTDTNTIHKQLVLRSPRTRVWRALTNTDEFGTWFRVKLDGSFRVGETIHGHVTHPGYEHLTFSMTVVRMDPETTFAYRWHPYPSDPAVDYSTEPMTLVEFSLEDAEEGTRLTLTESGFDQILAHRRTEAFRANDQGWTTQIENIRAYVEE